MDDGEMVNFAITGTNEEWNKALNGEDPSNLKNIQIATQKEVKKKRRLDDEEIEKETNRSTPGKKKKESKSAQKPKKQKKSKRKSV